MAGVLSAAGLPRFCWYDYTRRLAKDPLESTAFKTLVAALDQQPTNEVLKEQIRDVRFADFGRNTSASGRWSGRAAVLLLVAVAFSWPR